MRPARLGPGWLALGVGAVLAAAALSLTVGPVALRPDRILAELVDRLPGVDLDSGLDATEATIVWELRLPRLVLGLMVGSLLAVSGAAYQGVFRNPLASPFLLGIAAGAGLGATLTIASGATERIGFVDPVPLGAFVGAAVAVVVTMTLGRSTGPLSSPATLLLAGVAVAAFFTALQTYVQQQNADTLREVYTWVLGRLTTSGWSEVGLLAPYAVVSVAVLLTLRGTLDVLAVGEEEASGLGLHPARVRAAVLVAASLAAASAVAVSGLIGFVGLIVPHAVRLTAGVGNRVVLPLSLLFGGAFLAVADTLARTVDAPAELPIGVVTAFFGAPFFLVILRRRSAGL